MFNNASTEISDGLFQLEEALHGIQQRANYESSGGHSPSVSRMLKGLFFVQMYALYERTVNIIFEEAVAEVNSRGLRVTKAVPGLVVLHCAPQFKALKDLSLERSWGVRQEVIKAPLSAGVISIDVAEFPIDGSHYRSSQIRMLCEMFGIYEDPLSHSMLHARVTEIVETRNSVAHGRVPAMRVGQNFSYSDLERKLQDLTRILYDLLGVFRRHFSTNTNLHRF